MVQVKEYSCSMYKVLSAISATSKKKERERGMGRKRGERRRKGER
jgi:hypothetical protein